MISLINTLIHKIITKTNSLHQTISHTRKEIIFSKFRKAAIKNFRILLVLQILTLIAAAIGALTYLSITTIDQKGIVKGILYTGNDSSVMIDNQVLEEGDTIYGIKIVKIYPRKVEFVNNGKRWSQRICEHPNPAWTNTDEKYCSSK